MKGGYKMRVCRCCGEVLDDTMFYKTYDELNDVYRYSSFCRNCAKLKGYNTDVRIKISKEEAEKILRFKKIVENLKIHGNAYVLHFDLDMKELEEKVGKPLNVRDAEDGGFVIYVEK